MADKRDRAEEVALGVLVWLVKADLLDAFMTVTGADVEAIRGAAEDPAFLGAVMDFVLGDDDWVRRAAGAQNLAPETFLAVRAALPGGDQPHWT